MVYFLLMNLVMRSNCSNIFQSFQCVCTLSLVVFEPVGALHASGNVKIKLGMNLHYSDPSYICLSHVPYILLNNFQKNPSSSGTRTKSLLVTSKSFPWIYNNHLRFFMLLLALLNYQRLSRLTHPYLRILALWTASSCSCG